jgi:hypothetical protein
VAAAPDAIGLSGEILLQRSSTGKAKGFTGAIDLRGGEGVLIEAAGAQAG